MRTILVGDDDVRVGNLPIEQADLLISLGDVLDFTIEKIAARHGCQRIFAVKGNHDSSGPFPGSVTPLHCATEHFGGMIFGGFNGSWRYKPRGHHLFEQEDVSQMLCTFPRVDVFVAHNSPRGIHEQDPDVHQGFDGFLEYIERTQPSCFIHGHQHVNQTTTLGRTKIIGVFGEAFIDLNISG